MKAKLSISSEYSKYMNGPGISYCFAVQCAGDLLDKETAFNIYRKRHILPNFKLVCEDCESQYDLAILKMWNVAVEKVLKESEAHSKLNYEKDEDLTIDDAKLLSTEISKYPVELIQKFAKAIHVKVYIHDEVEKLDERAKGWYVMGMMMELELKKSDFFSKKAMAAVLIKLYDELKEKKPKENEDKNKEQSELGVEKIAWQESTKEKKGNEDENEFDKSELDGFERLARQLHIEVLSRHQRNKILEQYDQLRYRGKRW